MKTLNVISWGARIAVAVILLQTLFFKFTASKESVYIFSSLGLEPSGRIFSGIVELLAAILILIPKTGFWGAFVAIGVMSGAILSHILVLGIAVMGDGGLLFALALVVWVCCAFLLYRDRTKIADIFKNKT